MQTGNLGVRGTGHAFAILQPADRSLVGAPAIAVATQGWSSAETSEGYAWF